jgi:hypothetical protein
MQKLERRNTYTPTNIPHIRSNCDLPLNVEETLCVTGLKTFSNNSDAALIGFRSSEIGLSKEMSLSQKLLSIDYEHDCRFVNPASTSARGQIPPAAKAGGFPLTP